MNIRGEKLMICGINGSGKSNAGYYIASKQFRRFLLFTPHEEDIKEAPKNAIPVLAKQMNTQELNTVLSAVKKLVEERKIDGVLLDDIDVFVTDEKDLKNTPVLKDATINHRHWGKRSKEDNFGLSMIFMSRRPQNVPAALFEVCENGMFFTSPTSDNVKRKYDAIYKEGNKQEDNSLYKMVQSLPFKSYKFVYFRVGEKPIVCNPLPLFSTKVQKSESKLKGESYNDKARS